MKKLILLCSALGICFTVSAQSLAVNTDGSSAASSALFDVKSTEKGILVPRMTKTERNAITAPATGLLVFQNSPDSIGFYFYGGSKWLWINNADNIDTLAWKRSGNAGTVASSHFIGTTDNRPLRFRINNIWAGELDSTRRNVFFGLGAGQNNTNSSRGIVAIGNAALKNMTVASNSIVIGDSTMYNSFTSNSSIAIGNRALFTAGSHTGMMAIGDSALYSHIAGIRLTGIGYGALRNNNFGFLNTAVGYHTLYNNTTGYENTALGYKAGFSNTTSGLQTAIGDSALYANTGDNHHSNTALGAHAGAYNPSSSAGIYIGLRAGWYSVGGFGNIYMGTYSGEKNSGDFNIAIGQQSMRNNSSDFNVAIGALTMELNTKGGNNTIVGASSFTRDTTGNYNSALGYWSMRNHLRNDYNVAVGAQSLFDDTVGTRNVAVGYQSMFRYNGSNNVAVGNQSLDFTGSGSFNTLIGSSADVGVDNLTNATAIGYFSRVDTSNSMVLGGLGTNVSVNTYKPMSRMDVNGSIGSAIRSVVSSVTATVTDHTIVIANSVGAGTVAITLPAAASVLRREYRIVNQNVATNKSISSYLDFSGAAVTTLPANNAIVVQSNGTAWVRVL